MEYSADATATASSAAEEGTDIVVITEDGVARISLSKYRPRARSFVVTNNPYVAHARNALSQFACLVEGELTPTVPREAAATSRTQR